MGKTDRLEIDITSLPFDKGWVRLDWGWAELLPIGEENRNGYLVFTENRLESALRAYLTGMYNSCIGTFKWTWDKYSK